MATKKSKNPMEFRVEYSGIPLECGGTGKRHFRNFSSAIKFYELKYVEREDTPGHIIKLYDNIKNELIAQCDTTSKTGTVNTKGSASCDKHKLTKKRKKYDVRLQKVGYDKKFYPERYFYKKDPAEKFFNDMCQIESVSGVILYDRELNKNVLEYIREEVREETMNKKTVFKKESRIQKFLRELKELFVKSDSLL